MGRGRAQAARLRRAGRLRDRAEDRRLGDLARLRERATRSRRNARRRTARGGRHRQPAHDPVDPAHAPRRRTAADGGARRGVLPALGLPSLQRRADRGRKGACSEPAQRRRGLAAPARLADHGRAPALGLDLRHRLPRGRRAGHALRDARVAARAGLPDRIRSPSGSSRSRRSQRPAPSGSGGAPTSTTRSTESWSRSTRSTSSSVSARSTTGRAGRAPTSGRR